VYLDDIVAQDDVGVRTRVSTLNARWPLALAMLDKVANLSASLDKQDLVDTRGAERRRWALTFCADTLYGCLKRVLEESRSDAKALPADLAKIAAKPGVQKMFDLLKRDGISDGCFDGVASDLMAIADGDEALELFDGFNQFNQGMGAHKKAMQLGEVAASTVLQGRLGPLLQEHADDWEGGLAAHQDALSSAGRAMDTLTALQALLRPLGPGEARQAWVDRVLNGLPRRKRLTFEPTVERAMRRPAPAARGF